MTRLHELAALGQAIWIDFIRRSFVASELEGWIARGVRGVTSNPSILERAIAGSADYDGDVQRLAAEGRSALEIYEALAVEDIRRAADLLRPLYDATAGGDGYVSLEVSPDLANDTGGTIAEALRLRAALARPNVLIKVPATAAGIPAIQALIGQGISINVTLIFSLSQYRPVVEAYLAGLEERAARSDDLTRVASVASFFVSRLDTVVDRLLQATGTPEALAWQGQAALANAKVAYAYFREALQGPRWERLAQRGARVQRLLWASTSTKDPRYPDTLYVDNLIGPDTVNTTPPATISAFLEHGQVREAVEEEMEQARAHLARLTSLGMDLERITRKLQEEGVASFSASFHALIASIERKRASLIEK